jgi:predicted PhzF superfamily epimerase YddE/YHI9
MEVTILNCFCNDSSTSGNPCGVIQQFLGTTAEKQQLAAQLNLPVLVFISSHDDGIPMLEYFYPDTQMPLCIHGTLGAASVLFDICQVQNFKCQTASGLSLSIYFDNEIAQVNLSISHKPIYFSNINEIYPMLGLQDDAILSKSLPCKIASVPILRLGVSTIKSMASTFMRKIQTKSIIFTQEALIQRQDIMKMQRQV